MKQKLAEFLRFTPLYPPLRFVVDRHKYWKWHRHGCPSPPPQSVKYVTLREYARMFRLEILVETGTYYGDMIHALQRHFRQIYSIELSDRLYRFARRRFSNLEHVELIHGDSAEQLRRVVQRLQQPALFWLDGHYSGGVTALGATQTPVWDELHCIYGGSDLDHVTIIDDARLFGTEADYPTMEAVRELILRYRPDYTIEKKGDMIRIGPKSDSRQAAGQFS